MKIITFTLCAVLIYFFIPESGFSQPTVQQKIHFPQEEINSLTSSAFLQKGDMPEQYHVAKNESRSSPAKFFERTFEKKISITSFLKGMRPDTVSLNDTLVVGATANDTLRISGAWTHIGPIVVLNDGVLIFKNANATIVGDIFVLGHGKAYADSSTLYFPQQYWYQRSILLVQNSYLDFSNTTLNYGGYPFGFSVMDSASANFNNMTHTDYTTTGMNGHASININGDNLTGEFIISDYVNLHLKHATQALLWHQFPDTAVITHTFPSGSSLISYTFNQTTPGVTGIGYSVIVDTSTNVQWGMMPANGSDVTISNSAIRSIGLWFTGTDTANVSGLVDNSSYTNFVAPLSDRNLHLINTAITTWSAYTFNNSVVSFSGCILGEVGSMGTSKVTGQNYWVDGSGGYQWASDTSTYFNVNTTTSSNVRSSRNGMLIFAYSTENNGVASAIGNSYLLVIQSVLPQDPIVYEGGVVWYDNIGQVSSAYVDTFASVIGSAWIDRGPSSTLMDFASYQVFYQKANDTLWTAITSLITSEVRNNQLVSWNTYGLVSGNYNLKVTLHDNLGDSVEAVKQVNLLPAILLSSGDLDIKNNFINIYPNPFCRQTILQADNQLTNAILTVDNCIGQTVKQILNISGQTVTLHRDNLPSGLYFVRLTQDNKVIATNKLLITN